MALYNREAPTYTRLTYRSALDDLTIMTLPEPSVGAVMMSAVLLSSGLAAARDVNRRR